MVNEFWLTRGRRVMAAGALAAVAAGVTAETPPRAPAPAPTPAPAAGRPAAAQLAAAQPPAAQRPPVDATGLDLPDNIQILGKVDPDVRKATAIVNNTVITGTDVDQRVALISAANNVKIPEDERERLKLQVLRQLIDETLQIQEAKAADITIAPQELNQSFDRLAGNFKRSPAAMRTYLRDSGSSERSLRRQIEGELAWQRYLRRRIEPSTNVGEEEVKSVLARLEAAKGQTEYNLKEIFLRAPEGPAGEQAYARARAMVAEIGKQQQPFEAFARQYSEASTRAVNGDLGWVRTSALPAELVQAVQQMQVGQIAGPVEIPGGFSILYLTDKRQVLTADPRDAKLSLKQLTVRFPTGQTQAQLSARAAEFGKSLQTIQGCGSVDRVAKGIGAEVVDNDTVRVRDLPPQLQDIMLRMQVGQSTPPFGNPEEGVRALVLCGRDEVRDGQLPNAEQVQNQLEQQRVNLRAQQKLRDLRRDAVVEYR